MWQPIEDYNVTIHPFYVLISDGKKWSSVGAKIKYWHDLTEGDFRVTSPMFSPPTHWMPLPDFTTSETYRSGFDDGCAHIKEDYEAGARLNKDEFRDRVSELEIAISNWNDARLEVNTFRRGTENKLYDAGMRLLEVAGLDKI
jgi:hypothetical protein